MQGPMDERNFGSAKQFVPSGVDAQSWIGFEHRIQERRFNALVETITGAVARRDGIAARAALEEARELRPDAPELERLAPRVALLPVAVPSATTSAYLWYRGLGAVAMFVVGIGLVIGIEHIGPASRNDTPASVMASASAPPALVTPSPAFGAAAPALTPEPAPALVAVGAPLGVKSTAAVVAPAVAAPLPSPVASTESK